MTSTVTNYSANINVTYPTAGVDNDTQGFRDNFNYIQNALSVAAGEISALQAGQIYNIQSAPSQKTINATNSTTSFLQGSYQTLSISTNTTLSITDWPTGNKVGKIQFEVYNGNCPAVTTLGILSNPYTMLVESNSSSTITLSTSTTTAVIVDVWFNSNNNTLFVKQSGIYK